MRQNLKNLQLKIYPIVWYKKQSFIYQKMQQHNQNRQNSLAREYFARVYRNALITLS